MTKQEIENLARSLMNQHGVASWSFRFDSHKRRFGVCCYMESYIGLSWPVCQVNTIADITDTILHEIAHVKAGPWAGHGMMWKLQAQLIGARPETCAARHVNTPAGRWVGQCACRTMNRYRQPKPGAVYQCMLCRQSVTWQDTKI